MSTKGASSSSRETNTPSTPPPLIPATGNLHKDLKCKLPDEFTGERSQFRSFFMQVDLYAGFNSTKYASETEKVLWCVSFFRGKAASWIEGYLANYLENHNQGKCTKDMQKATIDIFHTWDGFKEKAEQVFGEVDEGRQAERELQRIKQRGSAAQYLAEFQKNSVKTNWNDDALMAQFYRGLKDPVKDDLAREQRPTTLEGLIQKAVQIDNRNYERAMEKRGYYDLSAAFQQMNVKGKGKGYQNKYHSPMELDATGRTELSPQQRQKHMEERTCFSCGKPGHLARNCKGKGKQTNRRGTGRRGELNATGRGAYNETARKGGYQGPMQLNVGERKPLDKNTADPWDLRTTTKRELLPRTNKDKINPWESRAAAEKELIRMTLDHDKQEEEIRRLKKQLERFRMKQEIGQEHLPPISENPGPSRQHKRSVTPETRARLLREAAQDEALTDSDADDYDRCAGSSSDEEAIIPITAGGLKRPDLTEQAVRGWIISGRHEAEHIEEGLAREYNMSREKEREKFNRGPQKTPQQVEGMTNELNFIVQYKLKLGYLIKAVHEQIENATSSPNGTRSQQYSDALAANTAHLSYLETLASKLTKEKEVIQQDLQTLREPEDVARIDHPRHKELAWNFCCADSCLTHLGDKQGATYWPRKHHPVYWSEGRTLGTYTSNPWEEDSDEQEDEEETPKN
jgi:Retrotransposon gag protein/Zinc knuckle